MDRLGAGMQRAHETETTTQTTARTFGPGRAVAGLEFERYFTKDGVRSVRRRSTGSCARRSSPTNAASSSSSSATSSSRKFWSQQATNIVVSKYFRGQIGTPERERSVKQLIGRVVDTITSWAREQEYFASEDDLQAFSDDLKHLLRLSEGLVQQPGLVQLRLREGAAVLGLLHQLGAGHDGVDPRRWPRPRACSSSSDPARARTSRRSGRRGKCWPAAARRRGRSRS